MGGAQSTFMTQNSPSTQLLDPVKLGSWIFQRSYIWQMELLTAQGLAEFATKRGFPLYREEHIHHLWKLGLLRADLIVSEQEIDEAGFVFLGKEEDTFLYADARDSQPLQDTSDVPLEEAQDLVFPLKIYFHPFRFAVLHCLSMLVPNTSPLQIIFPQMYQTSKIMEIWLRMVQSGESSFYSAPYWNDVVALLVATEPCFYERIFRHLHIRLFQNRPLVRGWSQENGTDEIIEASSEELRAEIDRHWHEVTVHYRTLDLDRLKQLHQSLSALARNMDKNTDVHMLLRLGNEKLRLNLEGNLGGAMLFRTMAEFLRRAVEEVFTIRLPEEDEWYDTAKERLFGSNRLFDGDRNAAHELLRQRGLGYGPRLRWYVEGQTEFWGLNDLFRDLGATDIEILNLRGQIVQKNEIAFRESLRSDIRMGIFSFVSLDKDVSRNFRTLRAAVQQDQICGSFFVSDPDFEFGNFDRSELQTIIWNMALEQGADSTKKSILFDATSTADKGETFIQAVKKVGSDIPELWNVSKGEVWGKRLIQYALQHPKKLNGETRLCVKAIQQAIHSRGASYNYTRLHYQVDLQTGQTIRRDTPMTTQERLNEI
jgi:hypothetical protein